MNIPSLLKLIVAAFFLVNLPAQVHALTPDQVFDKVKESIVVVKTLDAQGKVKGQGSGVLLPSGMIATNYHVVEGGASYQVGRGKQLVPATLYAEDRDKDICLLDAKGITGTPAQLGKAADLKVGVSVYAVGAPRGLELSLSDGIVSQLRGGPPPFIQTTAAISPGSSGGGLFDGEGRLVGLTTLYIADGQNLNFAMPVEWIGEIKPGRKTAAGVLSQTEWIKRALALLQLKDLQGLFDWYQKWTKSEPNNDLAWLGLGSVYGELKRYENAIDAFRQALRINPEYAFAWNNLGIAYAHINRHNEAIEAYRQTIRINPEYAEAWRLLGDTYHELKRYNEAIEAYRQALRINPEFAAAWNNLGGSYRKLNRNDDAIEAYRQALRIDPERAEPWFNIGIVYVILKRFDNAIDAFRQTVRINPEHAEALYFTGTIYNVSGNQTAALDVVQKLRRINPAKADKLFNEIVPR